MPAETIHGAGIPVDVKVSWGHDCDYIQVATEHDQGAKNTIVMVNSWLEAAEMPTIDFEALDAKVRVAHGTFAWHATLDSRRSVNKLIATLRRARDAAFGRDE